MDLRKIGKEREIAHARGEGSACKGLMERASRSRRRVAAEPEEGWRALVWRWRTLMGAGGHRCCHEMHEDRHEREIAWGCGVA